MPTLRVVERLTPLPLNGSPEVESSQPSSTSPFYSLVLVRVIILTGILTGILTCICMLFTCLYKYKRLQGSQGSACPNMESNTPVAHVPKASRGQGMSPPPVSSNLGFILCRLRGISFSKFSHPPENLTHETCKPNVHATCGKYMKGKCMQSETVSLVKPKSPKSTGEYESDVFHRFNRFKTFHHGVTVTNF